MSRYDDVGDEALWNPSNGGCVMLTRQVPPTGGESGAPSGIRPMESDETQIDPAAFGECADALLARHRATRRAVVRTLGEGFTAAVPVLAERAGVCVDRSAPEPQGGLRDVRTPWPDEDAWDVPLRERGRAPDRVMPR
ncbi:DUF6086 family protein [Streptomyces sp. NPDC001070]